MPMIGRGTYIREEVPFRHIRQLLNSTEVVVFATRRHWIIYIREVTYAVLGTIAAIALAFVLPADYRLLANVFFLGAGYLYLRMFSAMWSWAHEWFIVTSTRVMVIKGYFAREQAVMPIKKVTDFTYKRSFWGEILGYGKFIFESAGQDQALTTVPLIPHSDQLNRELSDELFGGGKVEGVKKRRITAHHKFVEYFIDFKNFFGAPFVLLAQFLGWGRNAEAPEDEAEPFFEEVEPAPQDAAPGAATRQPTAAVPSPEDVHPTGPVVQPTTPGNLDLDSYQSRRPSIDYTQLRPGQRPIVNDDGLPTDEVSASSDDPYESAAAAEEQWRSVRVTDDDGNAVTAYRIPPGAQPAPRRNYTEPFYRDEGPPEWLDSEPLPATYDEGFDRFDDYDAQGAWQAEEPASFDTADDVPHQRGYDLTDISSWPEEYFLDDPEDRR